MFKEISPNKIDGNFIDMISNEWMLISAGDENGHNMMTASWGFVGEIWGNNSVVAALRPQRHTMKFVNASDYFTLSFYGDNKEIHKVCGSMSGKDVDKTALTGLTPVFEDGTVYFKEARLVLICKKQYVDQLKEENFTDKEPLKCYDKDYHYMVVGKIVKALVRE